MKVRTKQTKPARFSFGKFSWAGFSPWVILGAAAILAPLYSWMALTSMTRHEAFMNQLLMEKGEALIRSYEAGARTGLGLHSWGYLELQKLLIETAQQKGVDYMVVVDGEGTILADSDPSSVGRPYGTDLDLKEIARSRQVRWRRVPNPGGEDSFEVYRGFSPAAGRPPFGPGGRISPPVSPETIRQLIVFVGLDTTPLEDIRKRQRNQSIAQGALFLLIGCAGFLILFIVQEWRTTRQSLSRIKAFSDRLVEHMPIGLIAVGNDGLIAACNRSAEDILGLAPGGVDGRPAREILPQCLRDLLTELRESGKTLEKELECQMEDGRTLPLEALATTLESEEGTPLGSILLFRDIAEMRQLKEEVVRSQRLASLGSLAAGVAHEIRNPLSSIKGFATYFRERYRDVPEDRGTADILIQEVDRLNRVITQLLEFARPMTLQRVPVSIGEAAERALRVIAGEIREKNIAVEIRIPSDLPAVTADPDRLHQVFLNLYLNALAAMKPGGILTTAAAADPEGAVRVRIADTGAGIPVEDLLRVFDPYYTTKPSGTGLGLAIVHKIVEAHGGDIRLESEPGRGTTVTFRIPGRKET
ncbi:MAG: PAS domain S-box protein [Syntrophaceae bacterium]|nr:PAS domain S-box protein [Syntrophaceae bacterium]